MKDIQLNSNGDLYINSDGDIEITDSIAQAIRIRLQWFLNEWRFSPEWGVPYYEDILVKNPNQLIIRQRIREAILDVEEVSQVKSLDVVVGADRKCTVTYTAVALNGEEISEEVSLYAG